MTTRLSDLFRCFQGVVPSLIATSDRNGIPNITYVSQVYYVDEQHVALSRQFFSKTSRNLEQNPRATVEIYDPINLQPYRLRLRFLRSETSGALFDTMAMRIQAIASHTGMEGVFRLIASDVFAVEGVERVEHALTEQPQSGEEAVSPIDGLRSEMRGLQWISESINHAKDLESLLDGVLDALEVYFGFLHSMVLLQDETQQKLVAVASRGFGESGVGAEVAIGQGMIGTAARERRILRMTGLDASFRYSRAVRKQLENSGNAVSPEIPLPGYPDAQSAIVMPLVLGDQLIGVIAAQSRDPVRFDEWDETYLSVIGNQIALGIDRMMLDDREDAPGAHAPATPRAATPARAPRVRHSFVYYRSDDAVFVDNDYLIRNVPARILWKLLGEWKQRNRTEFSNRELRLDPALGLPEIKDNLESRLILLRRRLEEKATGVRIVSAGRGRFTLVVDAELELSEK